MGCPTTRIGKQPARQRSTTSSTRGSRCATEWSNGVYSEFGAYRDSGGTTAKFADIGYQWRFSNFRIGGALAIARSPTYHDGHTFIAPIPVVSYDFGRVMLNAVYFHKVRGMNEIAAFGAYLTIRF